jgi:hypothetical protein
VRGSKPIIGENGKGIRWSSPLISVGYTAGGGQLFSLAGVTSGVSGFPESESGKQTGPQVGPDRLKLMRYLKYAVLLGILAFLCAGTSQAQVRVGVGFGVGPVYGPVYGPAPVCPYGYYGYYPYACAPYGYYGPDWFANGIFIGAGPWFHGYYGRGFYGRPGYYGRGYVGRGGFVGRAPASRGFAGGGFHGGRAAGGFHGGGAFHGGGGFHGGGRR